MPRPKKPAAAPRAATTAKTTAKTRVTKARKARAKRANRRTDVARGTSAPQAALSELSTEMLAAELARRRSELPRLEQQAAALRGQLAALESRIALLSGGGAPVHAKVSAKASGKPSGKPSRKTSVQPSVRSGMEGARGPRTRRDGRPTLGALIAQILGESRDALALREIADRAAKALGRAVNPSFLVQTSQTLRKLVVRGAAAQPSRGMYARGSGASDTAKEGSHAGESAQRQE